MGLDLKRIVSGHELLEAPLYHPEMGLLCSEVAGGGVWRIPGDGTEECVVRHRRGIGGMALHESGGVIVSGRNVALRPLPDDDRAGTVVLADRDPDNGVIGFNDLVTDARGRIYVGSVSFVAFQEQPNDKKPGRLHMIDLDGSVRVVAEDVLLTNGLGFSPDGRLLYHSDSGRRLIRVYDVAEDGSLGMPSVFATIPEGKPDGLAVAQDGTVWVALAFAGIVGVFAPNGKMVRQVAVPDPMVTSLCFGGADMKQLFITSGQDGADPGTRGGAFRTVVDVAGMPRPLARVPLGGVS